MSEPEQEPIRVPVHQGPLVLRKQGKDTSRYFILYTDTLEYFKSHDECLSADVQPRGCLVYGDFTRIEMTDDGVIFSHQDDWGVHLMAEEQGDIRPWLDAFTRILPATHTEGENRVWTVRAEEAAEEAAEESAEPDFPAKPVPLCVGWAQVERKHGALARRYFELTDECLNYYESDKHLEELRPPRGVIQFHDLVSFKATQLKFSMYLEELKKPVVLQVDTDSDFDMWGSCFRKVLEARLGDKFVMEREEPTSDDLLCQSTFDLEVEGRTETKLVRLFEDRLEYAAWSEEAGREAAVEKSIPAESINDIEIEDDGLVLEVEGLGQVGLHVAKQAPGRKAADLEEWVTAFRRVCRSDESPSPAPQSPERRDPPGKPAPDKPPETLTSMEMPIEMPHRREALLDDSVEALYQGLVSLSDNGSARATHCVTMCRDRFLYFSKQGDASSGAQLKQVLASDVRKIVVLDDGFQVVLDDRTLEFHDLKRFEMEEWALSFRGIASWKAQQPPPSSPEDRHAADADEPCAVEVVTSGTALADAWASKMTPNQRHSDAEHTSERRVSFEDTEQRARSHSPRPRFFVPRCGRIPPPERYRSPEPRKRTSLFTARGRRKLGGHRANFEQFVINTCRSGPQPTKLLHGSEHSFITTGKHSNDDEHLLVKFPERDPELPLPPSKHAVSCLAAKITGDTPRNCTGKAGGFTWTKITTSEDRGSSCTPRQPSGGFSITGKVNEANRSIPVKKEGLVGKITDPGRAAGSFRRASSQTIPGKITDAARETHGWVKHASRSDSVQKYKDMAAKTYIRNKLWH